MPSSFEPCYDGVIAGWTVNHLKRNFWRVEGTMEWADCLQEAQVVFLRLAAAYPDIDTPQHFLALYKTSWQRWFDDLSTNDTKRRAEVRPGADEDGAPRETAGCTDNDGYLRVLVRQAPAEVRSVFALFLNAPQEILDLALADWRGGDHRASNRKVCRLLGLDEGVDVLGMTEDYLTR